METSQSHFSESKEPKRLNIDIKTHSTPYLDKRSKQLIQNIKKCVHVYGIRRQTQNLVNYWKQNYHLDQMIVNIKDNNYIALRDTKPIEQAHSIHPLNSSQLKPKNDFQLQLYPRFEKYFDRIQIQSKSLYNIFVWNMLSEFGKEAIFIQELKFRKKQLAFNQVILNYSDWRFSNQFKFGKPLDQNFVADSSKFTIYKVLSDNRQQHNINIQKNTVFVELKGYQNRLKEEKKQQPGMYLNRDGLKYQDVCEIGYCSRTIKPQSQSPYSYFKFSIGASFYTKCLYYKLKYFKEHHIPIVQDKLILGLESKFSVMNGVNIHHLPHEMLSRNQNKWMNERSTGVINLRANLYTTGNKILSFLGIWPYNYASVWISDNFTKHNIGKIKQQPKLYGQNIKVEAELGVGLKLYGKKLYVDIPLFRMQGKKGEPKFGIRYQF